MSTETEPLASIHAIAQLLARSAIEHRVAATSDGLIVPARIGGECCDQEIVWPRGSLYMHLQQRLPCPVVPEERGLEVMIALSRLNTAAPAPGFVIDESGGVSYRLVVFCDERGMVAPSQIKSAMATCMKMAEAACPALREAIHGRVEAEGDGNTQPGAAGAPWWADEPAG